MQYTSLGRTGLKVSRLCLGTMNFGPHTSEADSFAIMDRALELGFNFWDTANVYGWKLGQGVTAYDQGTDVGLVCTGYMIRTARIAAQKLKQQGIGVRVDHHPSLKPFDRDLLYDLAHKVSCIVTLENHCTSGGLFSLVAEALAVKGIGLPVGAIGTDPDDFIHTGHVNDLLYRYKMTSDDVVEKALANSALVRGDRGHRALHVAGAGARG